MLSEGILTKNMSENIDGSNAPLYNDDQLQDWADLEVLGELGIDPEDDDISPVMNWNTADPQGVYTGPDANDIYQSSIQLQQNMNNIDHDFSGVDVAAQIKAGILGILPQPQQHMPVYEEQEEDESECSEYEQSDDGDESDCEEYQKQRSRKRKRGTTTPAPDSKNVFTTPSGHKRGPLNGGLFIPAKRDIPGWITNFVPRPYIGPPVQSKGSHCSTNTQGQKVDYNIYRTIADDWPGFPTQVGISYDSRGRLSPNVIFDRDTFFSYVEHHPLGKNLWFRLEKFPANCKGFGAVSEDHPTYNKCRFKDCPSKEKGKRGFHDGTIRVAIEEVLGRLPRGERMENNPYFCAGYLHIDCLENLMDIGQLIRAGMLRPKPREFHEKEPHTSKTEPQVLCPPAKLVTCFEEFCKRVIQTQWDGYLLNLADRLQTYVWLSVQKKGKWSTHDAPSEMSKEDAQELLRRRPVDPNWGGGRRPGLPMKTVKKAEAGGKRRFLVGPGTGRNSEKAKTTASKILQEFEDKLPEDEYEDGNAWLQDCYIELASKDGDVLDPSQNIPSPSSSRNDSPRRSKRQRRSGSSGYGGGKRKHRASSHRMDTPTTDIYDSQLPYGQQILHADPLSMMQQSTDPSIDPACYHQQQNQYQGFTNDIGAYYSPVDYTDSTMPEILYPPISAENLQIENEFPPVADPDYDFGFQCAPPGQMMPFVQSDFVAIDPQLMGDIGPLEGHEMSEDDMINSLFAVDEDDGPEGDIVIYG